MAVYKAPPSLGFSRQEHWNGLTFPSWMHKSETEVAQSCPTLSNPMDSSLPGSSVHEIFQARVLEWGAIAFKWNEVTQSCPTLCDSMNCGLLDSSVHGIFQARILEWVAISFSRGSSWPRDWTQVSHIVGRCFSVWATREVPWRRERLPIPAFWLGEFHRLCIVHGVPQTWTWLSHCLRSSEMQNDGTKHLLKT